ncbi:thiamine-monophosphate kinase [Emticicia oligotrophica DSM 17448]|uniref:Thiamine-monophosphate kinase n=1 Tax=Emticicia oligotrophica (strain DSM 17448 / CIP 109782 / MTCC 6937 / GPTSA100-15) TaxID=929562 RepID=A0ABM5MYV8_EMTOG|nr:thiamine-phosphate kinase [Emticicia oligotrophica]AFK02362.1 thiamine-monophosphate kinase [Emticicia oligotrophica DSM 17448]
MERTELKTLGEFGLIDRIKTKFTNKNAETIKGIGDDAAVIDVGDKYMLVTTDILFEGIHFDLAYTPLRHLGYKAVAVNISDIAAMNGLAKQITVTIGLSNRISVEAIDELYEGIKYACDDYNVDLIGGDTSSSASGFVISITATGFVDKDKIVYRNGAKPNDILCVTGDLGAAYFGLQVLEREKQVYLANPNMQPELNEKEYLVGKILKPEARTDIVHELKEAGVVPTSMIDISDGLASEILHICTQSRVGAMVFEDKLPIEDITMLTATEFNISPITAALNGGEDYQLLFTINQADFEKIKNISDILPIGYITADTKVELALNSGGTAAIKAQGWNHLS